jgi:hypothetical protein
MRGVQLATNPKQFGIEIVGTRDAECCVAYVVDGVPQIPAPGRSAHLIRAPCCEIGGATRTSTSLGSECNQGVNAHGAPGGRIRRKQGDCGNDDADRRKYCRVGGLHPVEQTGDETSQSDRRRESDDDPQRRQLGCIANDEMRAEDLRVWRRVAIR